MTVIINRQEELEALIDKDNNIVIDDDLRINCDIDIAANIKALDIVAFLVSVKANNINACYIGADNINAEDIEAHHINADIEARNITANNIIANNINAKIINYDAFCIVYESLKCKTIEGRRKNSLHACLDQPIEYIK